jgi:5-methylthioadenosine/S-adenosylhomocysteine deaminase
LLAAEHPELTSPAFLARWPQSLEEAAARIGTQAARHASGELVRGFVGVYGGVTASDDLYAHAVAVARKAGVTVQEHLGYTPAEVLKHEAAHGLSRIERLAEAGLLGDNSSFVHMNRVSSRDVEILAEANAAIAWCPYGQLRSAAAKGFRPMFGDVTDRLPKLGLGTDIPHIINPDGLGALAVAASTAAGSPLAARDIFRMRTVGAARTVGCTDLGLLRVGHRADLVIRWPDSPLTLGADDSEELAVLPASDSVRHVLVNGQQVLSDGNPTRLDPGEVVERARESARHLLRRVISDG